MAEERLNRARELIRAKRYREARQILEPIADNATAAQWLVRIDERLAQESPFEDDPFADVGSSGGGYVNYASEKPKRSPYDTDGGVSVSRPERDYTLISIIILVLYWVFWLPGLIVNIIMLNEARQKVRESGVRPSGMGCLWALLLFNVVPLLLFCAVIGSLILVGPAVEEVFDEIVATIEAITPEPTIPR